MTISRRFLAAIALLLATVAPLSAQGNGEREQVLAVIQTFFDAMRAKDTAAVRATFEPGARLVGIRPNAKGETVVQSLSLDVWVAFIGRDKRPDWTERAWNPEVRITGTLATVWAEYDFHFGSTFSHCGFDAVQLLRTVAGWKIVSIADTYQPADCVRHPPP
ncbi:MAG: nuclear transport factor 2 family protein [Gemmatimonadota bacterium]